MSSERRSENIGRVADNAVTAVENAASSSRAAEFEAFVRTSTAKRITVQPDGGHSLSMMNTKTLFIRVIRDGRMGVSYTNDFRPKRVAECFRMASRLSSQHRKDESLRGFPSANSDYPRIRGLYDREVADLGFTEASAMVDELLDAVLDSDKDIQVTGGELSASHSVLRICNSNGIDTKERFTRMDGACAAVCGQGRSVSPECISMASSRRSDLPLQALGGGCSFVASHSCNTVRARTGECDVVFSPMALGSGEFGLLTLMLSRALSGMDLMNESTIFADRQDNAVASESLSLRDAPAANGRSGSRPFDDEGVPTRNRWLIRKGVLKSFVWDSYYGSRQGIGSTGNAMRDMNSGLVVPSPLLLEIGRGKGDMHDLISEVDDGYLIWGCQGAHTGSPETGAFSFVASPGLKIERGEIVGGVQGVMLSGNIIDLLQSVGRVGSDQADFGCSLMPSVLFQDVKITTG